MARYQLLRTSPALSGQVRIDLLLDKNPSIKKATNIHICPINDNIDFNESGKRSVLRYSHLDNIKNLYREIGSQFYSSEGEYSSDCWLYNEGVDYDPYSHVYMSGIKRMRYERYNKQFGFLMPLWISEPTDMNKMLFRVHVGRLNSSDELIDNVIGTFRLSEDIIKYLNDYLQNSANGKAVSDNLLSVDFDNMNIAVNGVQADTGQYACIDVSYILPSLLDREKPVIETDALFLNLFSQNRMIAQQLLNLQFIFNIEDFSSAWTEIELYRWKMNIWIDAVYDGEELPLKDIYTNSQFIPKYDIINHVYDPETNCLNYMDDYKCLDYIRINRFTQPIFHWSLVNAPRQIFNLYSGCAPKLYIDNTQREPVSLIGGNFNWIDISQNIINESKQNWRWIAYNNFNTYNSYIQNQEVIINSTDKDKLKDGTFYTEVLVKENTINIGGNLFSKYKDEADKKWLEEHGIINILENSNISLALNTFNDYHIEKYNINSHMFNNIICVDIQTELDQLSKILVYNMSKTYAEDLADAFITHINEIISNDNSADIVRTLISLAVYITGYLINPDSSDKEKIDEISNLYDRWIKPHKIEFYKSLYTYNTTDPILGQMPEEIKYADNDNEYIYLYRYSGAIQPMFINPAYHSIYSNSFPSLRNFYYKYIQWNTNTNIDIIKRYSKLRARNYPMQYPSVYVDFPEDKYPYYPWIEDNGLYMDKKPDFYSEWKKDVFWMKDNEVWILPVKVVFEIEESSNVSKEVLERDIWEGFKGALSGRELVEVLDEAGMQEYIYGLYNITQNFEYASIDDINHIIYTVTFKLR